MDKKYTVEKILDNIVTLEDRETRFLIDFDRRDLPDNIHEGSILSYSDNKFVILEEEEKILRESLRERLERLKKLNG